MSNNVVPFPAPEPPPSAIRVLNMVVLDLHWHAEGERIADLILAASPAWLVDQARAELAESRRARAEQPAVVVQQPQKHPNHDAEWRASYDAGGREAMAAWLADVEAGRRWAQPEPAEIVLFAEAGEDGMLRHAAPNLADVVAARARVMVECNEPGSWDNADVPPQDWTAHLDDWMSAGRYVRVVGDAEALARLGG